MRTIDSYVLREKVEHGNWVRTVERLPENGVVVLATLELNRTPSKRFVSVACRKNGVWIYGDEFLKNANLEVIAWTAMPNPYRGG